MQNYIDIATESISSLKEYSVSLVGSYLEKDISIIKEIDYYIVVPRLTKNLMGSILGQILSIHKDRLPYEHFFVETRRGPFKFDYTKSRYTKQLHLLFEDYNSIKKLSPINYVLWCEFSKSLSSNPIPKLNYSEKEIKISAIEQFEEFNSCLLLNRISYKEWVSIDTSFNLVNKTKCIENNWEKRCLYKHIYETSVKIYNYLQTNNANKINELNFEETLTINTLLTFLNEIKQSIKNEK